jgi:hypothetical protein
MKHISETLISKNHIQATPARKVSKLLLQRIGRSPNQDTRDRGYLRGLVNELLDVILAEVAVPCIVNLLQHRHRLGFAHCHHSHLQLQRKPNWGLVVAVMCIWGTCKNHPPIL